MSTNKLVVVDGVHMVQISVESLVKLMRVAYRSGYHDRHYTEQLPPEEEVLDAHIMELMGVDLHDILFG